MPDRVNLDRRIDIQSATEARVDGLLAETWTDLEADVPAQYLPVSGGEQLRADAQLATAIARFRIRYREDLTRKMRLVYESENWDIQHIEEDRRYDRRQYTMITAKLIEAT